MPNEVCLSVVYKAVVTSTDNNSKQAYIGNTSNEFKTRYMQKHHKIITAQKTPKRMQNFQNTCGS